MTAAIGKELEQLSKDIYSELGKTRKKARKGLLKLTENFKKVDQVKGKQLEKLETWKYLREVILQAKEQKTMPYVVKQTVAGEVHKRISLPKACGSSVKVDEGEKPGYVATMIHHPKPGDHEALKKQIKLLNEEGFKSNTEESREEAADCLKIVVGVNYCHSIHPKKNKPFKKHLNEIEKQGDNVHVFGFAWKPIWTRAGSSEVVKQKMIKREFRLLFEMDKNIAEAVYTNLTQIEKKTKAAPKPKIKNASKAATPEKKKAPAKKINAIKIPYQLLRETVKNDTWTKASIKALRHGSVDRPCFLLVADDDAVHYRTDETGLFTHYNTLIEENPDIQIASTGYVMKEADAPLVEIASRCDMVARRAIAQLFPTGVYYPEPNLLIRVGKNTDEELNRISFLRKDRYRLEAVGLLENMGFLGRKKYPKIGFGNKGEMQTTCPDRALTASIQNNTKVENNKKTLMAIRGFSQSHIFPKDGYSMNLARGLPYSNTTKIRKPLMDALKAFDPIDVAYEFPKDWLKIYTAIHSKIGAYYLKWKKDEAYEPNMDAAALDVIKKLALDKDRKEKISKWLDKSFNLIKGAHTALKNEKVSDRYLQKIVWTARNVSNAVHAYLKSVFEETEFEMPKLLE